MITIEEIPVERAGEFWEIQFGYLVDDGMLVTEEEKAYFSSREYRGHLEGLMRRDPDKLHMVYFVRDGADRGLSVLHLSERGWKVLYPGFLGFSRIQGRRNRPCLLRCPDRLHKGRWGALLCLELRQGGFSQVLAVKRLCG